MNKLILLLAIALPFVSTAQFHSRIEANPHHNGEVNPHWMNNYVIAVTNNNWATKAYIYCQYLWGEPGEKASMTTYEMQTFRTTGEALLFGKKFTNWQKVLKYTRDERKQHQIDSARIIREYKLSNHVVPNQKPKPIPLY